jgi:Domain of Unknown Function (DUF326)
MIRLYANQLQWMNPIPRPLLAWETSMLDNHFEKCIDLCLSCAKACGEVANAFAGVTEKAECVQACRECADTCVICAADLRYPFPARANSCRVSAWSSELCAIECERHQDVRAQRCAVVCRRCADECRHVRYLLWEIECGKFDNAS